MSEAQTVVLRRDEFDSVVFDMDGAVTKTAVVHAAAWKRLFDDYMGERSQSTGERWRPFDAEVDYRHYIDGKPRYDGVRSFLASAASSSLRAHPVIPPALTRCAGSGTRRRVTSWRSSSRTVLARR